MRPHPTREIVLTAFCGRSRVKRYLGGGSRPGTSSSERHALRFTKGWPLGEFKQISMTTLSEPGRRNALVFGLPTLFVAMNVLGVMLLGQDANVGESCTLCRGAGLIPACPSCGESMIKV